MDSKEYNITLQEDDAFSDTTAELYRNYEEETAYVALHYTTLITEIIKLILCLCVIAFDIFLIYIICRFKKLRCQTNTYILHYAIFNILYFVSAPIFYIMINFISFLRYSNINIFCFVIQIESSCLLFSFLFAFGLGFDWLIMCFTPPVGLKYSKVYKHFILILYVFGLTTFLIQSSFCLTEFSTVRHTIALATYIIILIFTVVLNYLNHWYKGAVKNIKISYSLTVANIIILSWLPMYIYHHLLILVRGKEILELILWFTEFIPEIIAYENPVVIVFMLGRLNKYFKMAYLKAFKKSVATYSNNEDNLDESVDDGYGRTIIPSDCNEVSYI